MAYTFVISVSVFLCLCVCGARTARGGDPRAVLYSSHRSVAFAHVKTDSWATLNTGHSSNIQ